MGKRRTVYWRLNGKFERIGYVTLAGDNVTVSAIVIDPQVVQAQLVKELLRRQFE